MCLGISESSPLHQYNMDVGDDDVFMVINGLISLCKQVM